MNSEAPIPPQSTPPQTPPTFLNALNEPPYGREVKVFNIPVGTDENELRQHFASNGEEVTNVRILPARDEEAFTTEGFVTFSTGSQATIAIDEKNNTRLKGYPLEVVWNVPGRHVSRGSGGGRGVDTGSCVVAVLNIPESPNLEMLKAHFASIGEVIEMRVSPHRDGRGTCRYTCEADSQRAVVELDNRDFNGSQLRVGFRLW